MTNPYSLSFVVPCYNEVDNIRLFKRRAFECFDAEGISLEIVFVNDGSQDGTFELLREVVSETDPSHPMQAVQFSRNFGKEAALYAGMEAARGECICTNCLWTSPSTISSLPVRSSARKASC